MESFTPARRGGGGSRTKFYGRSFFTRAAPIFQPPPPRLTKKVIREGKPCCSPPLEVIVSNKCGARVPSN